ncbi:MBL fold metallo-hydrolase [Halopiger xanaduensis]|uniref:Beta-lactamase domain protein n=1 Tax=Halopiger xanaduensis (strain DSM 18323 / JCM 14033 / SH-6) TaxID=797210 RepID=F8D4E1_HALXS|nr:MBL fold metallo-hydrolase [Halopiger xanaduensis]AEH38682.1 beta-lactamase domain protein [Halopiger xanaduensis SH-6]
MATRDDEPGLHALPITVEYGGREVTFNPAVVETERGLVLIDVGPEDGIRYLETHIDSLGYDLEDVWLALITHHDADHAGGLDDLLARTDATVATHRDEAPYVSGEREPIKGDSDGDRYPPVPVDLELVEGVRIPTLAGPMDVLETPGHTPGHISLHFPESDLLLAADALVVDDGALAGPRPEFTPDMDRAIESVEKLADLEAEHTVCYHGGYMNEGADRMREIYEAEGDE